MVQDRISVRTNGKSRVTLGRQTFLNCGMLEGLGHGCNGGDVPDVLEYMAKRGLPDETCLTYKASDASVLGPAPPGLTEKEHHCPSGTACRNCMPMRDDSGDYHCWSVDTPILYKVWEYCLDFMGVSLLACKVPTRNSTVCGAGSCTCVDG